MGLTARVLVAASTGAVDMPSSPTPAPSQIQIPRTLCLHLNRLGYGADGRQRKNDGHVQFPGLLDVGGCCWPDRAGPGAATTWLPQRLSTSPRILLRLTAAVVHLGDASSGHFIVYRKMARPSDPAPAPVAAPEPDLAATVLALLHSADGQWVRVSDDAVTPVHERVVLASEAYMLFYTKVLSAA